MGRTLRRLRVRNILLKRHYCNWICVLQVKMSTGQCHLCYSCVVCTAFLIKYKIINLVHHLRPFTIILNFMLYERQTGQKKKSLEKVGKASKVFLCKGKLNHFMILFGNVYVFMFAFLLEIGQCQLKLTNILTICS